MHTNFCIAAMGARELFPILYLWFVRKLHVQGAEAGEVQASSTSKTLELG